MNLLRKVWHALRRSIQADAGRQVNAGMHAVIVDTRQRHVRRREGR